MKYRATITIYSDFDPATVELSDLAREADVGSAICDGFTIDYVPDDMLPEGVSSFFSVSDNHA